LPSGGGGRAERGCPAVQGARRRHAAGDPAAAARAGRGLRLRLRRWLRGRPADRLAPPQGAARGRAGQRRAARPLDLLPDRAGRARAGAGAAALAPQAWTSMWAPASPTPFPPGGWIGGRGWNWAFRLAPDWAWPTSAWIWPDRAE